MNFLLDDYNSSNYLQETEDGLTDYLYSLKNKGKFENFLLSDEDTLIIQYKKKYYEVGQNDGFYFVKSVLSEEINKDGKYFIITAKNIKDGKIILRLFNAEGDRKQHNITFDMPLSSIEEVDLNGRVIDRKTIKTRTGKSEISISMPRFGLKTFALNLN